MKYRLLKKLCSNYRPEFNNWSIHRPAIILWTTVDTLPYPGVSHGVYTRPTPAWSPGGHCCPLITIMETINNKQELIFKSVLPLFSMDPYNWTEIIKIRSPSGSSINIVFLKTCF